MHKVQFRITGGLGKNIVATRVIAQFKAEYPDSNVRVMASYPDVFVNNPNIDRVYPAMQQGPDFYEANRDFDILEAEPYIDLAYRQGKEHIVDVWCRRLGLKSPSTLHGEIILTDEEKQWAENQKKQLNTKQKIVAIQISGGVSTYHQNDALDILKPKQVRSLPIEIAQEVVDDLQKKGFLVIQIGLPTEQRLERVLFINGQNNQPLSNRLIFATLNTCDHLISIDSFSHHAWVALGKEKATVLFGSTSRTSLGYSCNNNLVHQSDCKVAPCNRPEGVLFDIQGNGHPWQCSKKSCMKFNPKEIISAFNSTIETKGEQK